MLNYDEINEFREWINSTPTERIDEIIILTRLYYDLESSYLQGMFYNISKGKHRIGRRELKTARLILNVLVLLHKIKNKPKGRRL